MFEKSVLVVAHPDDEVLWFSSILDKVEIIIICFLGHPKPSIDHGRREVLSRYPLSGMSCLELDESKSFKGADWYNPQITTFGLKLRHKKKASERYEKNYNALFDILGQKLNGCQNVFTHNPWGEYGNEEHVQVYTVLKALQPNLDFNLWFSNYCSNKSIKLMLNYTSSLSTDYITLPTNEVLAKSIAKLYKEAGCWTWYKNSEWFPRESLLHHIQSEKADLPYGLLFPVNMLRVPFPTSSPKANLINRIASKIRPRLISHRKGDRGRD